MEFLRQVQMVEDRRRRMKMDAAMWNVVLFNLCEANGDLRELCAVAAYLEEGKAPADWEEFIEKRVRAKLVRGDDGACLPPCELRVELPPRGCGEGHSVLDAGFQPVGEVSEGLAGVVAVGGAVGGKVAEGAVGGARLEDCPGGGDAAGVRGGGGCAGVAD